ncbi:MAG TPA: helix-turn-helix transcriptional regulator [Candidatus Alectryocaccobium stercorigallinarum]|nr:helix-turn-helix transcriptional regulator [Candidatus Alectryocaccobium stercorigallinarum]
MIRAYSELYLDDAMRNMGEMMDYAANACYLDQDEFFALFMAGGFDVLFGAGDPKVVSGMSGTELAVSVLEQAGLFIEYPKALQSYKLSAEYWCGWIMAYYQWHTGISFKEIMRAVSFRKVRKLYPVLHEASQEKFVDTLNLILKREQPDTKLRLMRKQRGFSQRELAERSGVNIRAIQQYEQRLRDINKASVMSVAAMASAIGCGIEELLEYSV